MRKPIRLLTNKERAECKQRRLDAKSKLTLAFQLGFYIGEKIVNKYLPTLSVDGIHTNKNISVTIAEGDEAKRLNDVWFSKRMSAEGNEDARGKESEEEWKALRAYHEMLEEKYLPKTIDCHFGVLNITEEHMTEFKKGVSISLWDCDCSHYSTKLEDIDIKDDDDTMFTIITLKRT